MHACRRVVGRGAGLSEVRGQRSEVHFTGIQLCIDPLHACMHASIIVDSIVGVGGGDQASLLLYCCYFTAALLLLYLRTTSALLLELEEVEFEGSRLLL